MQQRTSPSSVKRWCNALGIIPAAGSVFVKNIGVGIWIIEQTNFYHSAKCVLGRHLHDALPLCMSCRYLFVRN